MPAELMGALSSNFSFSGYLPLIIVIFGFVGMFFGAIWIIKLKKFIYPVEIIRSLGNGKVAILRTKAGRFRKKKILFGLLDWSGSFEMLTKDKRKILEYSDTDMHIFNPDTGNYNKKINASDYSHNFNGRIGFICFQKPDDSRIIVPINTVSFSNMEAVMNIAPADYMDASLNIIKQSDIEMQTNAEKILAQALPFIYIMASVLVVIFLVQYGKYVIDHSYQYGLSTVEALKNVAIQLPSKAP